MPQFPLAEGSVPLPTPRADGCLGYPLTPRAGRRWPWAMLALAPADVVQPGEKTDCFGAELAVPPRRDTCPHGSNVAPRAVVP